MIRPGLSEIKVAVRGKLIGLQIIDIVLYALWFYFFACL